MLPSYLRGRSKTTLATILAKNTDTLSNRLVPKLCSLNETFLTSLPCKKSLKYIHLQVHTCEHAENKKKLVFKNIQKTYGVPNLFFLM